jgi:hypothetical protein
MAFEPRSSRPKRVCFKHSDTAVNQVQTLLSEWNYILGQFGKVRNSLLPGSGHIIRNVNLKYIRFGFVKNLKCLIPLKKLICIASLISVLNKTCLKRFQDSSSDLPPKTLSKKKVQQAWMRPVTHKVQTRVNIQIFKTSKF